MIIQKHRHARAFTLVELLVVIAIIVVLAAITSVVAIKVRKSADTLGCTSNLRQIGVALALYESDNGTYPALVEDWAGDPNQALWFHNLKEYALPFKGTKKKSDMEQQDWWYCPACRGNQNKKGWGQPDYGANPNLFVNRANTNGEPAGAESGIRLTRTASIANPARTIAVMETASQGTPLLNNTWGAISSTRFINSALPESAGDTKGGSIAFRHPPEEDGSLAGAKCNILFADGHVESVNNNDKRLQTKEGRAALMSVGE